MAKRVKKDFDKEKMYRKIMPSGGAVTEQAEKPAPAVMKNRQPGQPQPHNFMEDMVQDKVDHTIKVLDACGCERCRKDIVALALNMLPTAYAVADGNDTYYIKKLRGAYEVKVTAALIRAIQQVRQNPRH